MVETKVSRQINNFISDNIKKLEAIFPSAVKDGIVDFTALKEELGQYSSDSKKKYEFTWAGKQKASISNIE